MVRLEEMGLEQTDNEVLDLRSTKGRPLMDEGECNGICLTPADIGLPEFSYAGIAYAHPDCPLHGDPIPEDSDEYVCSPGEAEGLRYVREEDCAQELPN